MRTFIVTYLIFISLIGKTQSREFLAGISVSTNVLQRTLFTEDTYQPENSYFTYMAPTEGGSIINTFRSFNSYSVGGLGTYSFKKFTANLEPQFYLQRTKFTFQKSYYSERIVGNHSFRLPIFFTYRFFKKKNSLYLTLGWIFNASQNYDFQHAGNDYLFNGGDIYNGGVDYGDYHFKDILYSNDNFWQGFIGFGKDLKYFNLSFRMISRTPKSAEYIQAEVWQLEMNLSYHFLSTADFTKKRKIFSE